MEQELLMLRRKVTRLENMILNINDKLGRTLEKFLNHRASQANGFRNMLQNEEDVCISLITQLKTSSIGGLNRNNPGTARSHPQNPHQAPRSKPLPVCRKSTSQARTVRLNPRPQSSSSLIGRPQQMHQRVTAASTSRSRQQTDNQRNGNERCHQTHDNPNLEGNDPLSLDGIDEYTASSLAQSASVEGLGLDDNNLIIVRAEHIGQEPESEIIDMDAGIEVHQIDSSDGEPESFSVQANAPPPKRARVAKNPEFWRRRFAKKEYTLNRKFPDENTAREQVKFEKQWHVNSSQFTLKRKKIYYQCSQGRNCPISMYLSVPNDSDEVTEFISVGNHMHIDLSQLGPPRGGMAKKRTGGGGINSLIQD